MLNVTLQIFTQADAILTPLYDRMMYHEPMRVIWEDATLGTTLKCCSIMTVNRYTQ
jgi:hypothetical protein